MPESCRETFLSVLLITVDALFMRSADLLRMVMNVHVLMVLTVMVSPELVPKERESLTSMELMAAMRNIPKSHVVPIKNGHGMITCVSGFIRTRAIV